MEARLEELYFRSIVKFLNEGRTGKGIKVTSLVPDCLRRGYYSEMLGELYEMDGAIRMAVGRKCHEIPMANDPKFHEMELTWEGIVGHIDEFIDGIIVEKKYVREIPRTPNSYHVKQIQYYWALAEKCGYPVLGGAVLYINVAAPEVKAYEVKLNLPIDIIAAEMQAKKKALAECIEKKIVPPRTVTWMCQGYCPYFRICFSEEVESGSSSGQQGG